MKYSHPMVTIELAEYEDLLIMKRKISEIAAIINETPIEDPVEDPGYYYYKKMCSKNGLKLDSQRPRQVADNKKRPD